MSVRPANEGDAESVAQFIIALARLREHVHFQRGLHPAAASRIREMFLKALTRDDQAVFVAEEDDAAGAVGVQWITRQRSLLVLPEHRAMLSHGYIDPAHRRRGHMRTLIEASEAWLRQHDVELATMLVDPGNHASMQTFHSLGYVQDGVSLRKRIG
ncbi:MAG: GNAT family N-acetyltransferase [bacterium]|nr:GNAT family N-acetyltransferase [bacterium]